MLDLPQVTLWRAASAAAVVACALAGCVSKNGGEVQRAGTLDTTTAAPATRPRVDNPAAPDSTAGVGQATGRPSPAGVSSTPRAARPPRTDTTAAPKRATP
jgi:hypothetical protein